MLLSSFSAKNALCAFCGRGLTFVHEHKETAELECSYCVFSDTYNKSVVSCYYITTNRAYTMYRYIAGPFKIKAYFDQHDAYLVIGRYRQLGNIEVEFRNLSFNNPLELQKELQLILAFH